MGENVVGDGLPSVEQTVRDYQQANPEAKPKEIMQGKEHGLQILDSVYYLKHNELLRLKGFF